mmetsp:Transcript_19968/g.56560  ORF Transcript_19968/g.56560 Transcript_19968/m.56560 type:complete len:120 (+) Transcript_19968:150-509(+)
MIHKLPLQAKKRMATFLLIRLVVFFCKRGVCSSPAGQDERGSPACLSSAYRRAEQQEPSPLSRDGCFPVVEEGRAFTLETGTTSHQPTARAYPPPRKNIIKSKKKCFFFATSQHHHGKH